MADTARARPGGRTARVRAAVLDATVAELAEHGYAELTVEAVAARAGVNKTTLYRRWGGKDGLLVDAVEAFGAGQAEVPDTGQVDEDRKSTRLNSSHANISYAVFCLKKKKMLEKNKQ